jgi:hypothetical protein
VKLKWSRSFLTFPSLLPQVRFWLHDRLSFLLTLTHQLHRRQQCAVHHTSGVVDAVEEEAKVCRSISCHLLHYNIHPHPHPPTPRPRNKLAATAAPPPCVA